MTILDQIPVVLSAKRVLERLHLDGDAKYAEDVRELIDVVQPRIRPKVLYDVCYIDSKDTDTVEFGSARFTSRVLRVNLDKVERVFPYIATCGTEADDIEIPSDDLMKKFILDAIKEMALREAMAYFHKHIKVNYIPGKMSAMNPGSLEDWPISQQKELFSVFGDVGKLIGVRLTESYLMIPIKSVSGIYFPTEVSFENCQLCPREKCPGRRSPYDEKLKEKYFQAQKGLDG